MAQKTVVKHYDDISGDEIDLNIVDKPTTIFSVDGVEYEIDLGAKNRDKFHKLLDPYITAARRVGGRRSVRRTAGPNDKNEAAAARQWAIGKGIAVPARGRVPQAVIDQYRQAV
ncbi:Lsr2 family protein [Nocardia sp. NPDC023852]|uniref:histone-like nucleoid-structuring protein Lsr2 n=1 Tax=Nocardia sp. NPDC023852 TaxID=3154697 RepID=UPI00340C9F1B